MNDNRIDRTLAELQKNNKKAFITYITAGDPDLETTRKTVLSLDKAGVDIIELGIPFSDPIADGPVIQRAVQRSLSGGCTVSGVFEIVKKVRKSITSPIVFMTYYNIVYRRGVSAFVRDAKRCGADGLIVPDLPLEESDELLKAASREDFRVIMLTSPTTSPGRFKKIASVSRGFIYHVSLTGVTGVRNTLSSGLKKDLSRLKKLSPIPLCVGFGISGPDKAAEVARFADGVIVGSAIIKIIEQNIEKRKEIPGKVGRFAEKIAAAVHAV